jgi:hypothetical protein
MSYWNGWVDWSGLATLLATFQDLDVASGRYLEKLVTGPLCRPLNAVSQVMHDQS